MKFTLKKISYILFVCQIAGILLIYDINKSNTKVEHKELKTVSGCAKDESRTESPWSLQIQLKLKENKLLNDVSSLMKQQGNQHRKPRKQNKHTMQNLKGPNRDKLVAEEEGNEETDDPDYNAATVMRSRADHVRQQCRQSKHRHTLDEKDEAIYLVTRKSSDILYKPVPKIGWTTWIYLLFENGNKLGDVGWHPGKREWQWGWGTPYEEVGFTKYRDTLGIKKYKERFVIVRDPWDRLVSAYINKAIDVPFTYRFKLPCEWLTKEMPKLTFSQFVECIIDRAKASGKTLSSAEAALRLNEHWQPLHTITLPCITNYTMVADFNHFQSDTTAALSILKLNATLTHRNPTRRKEPLSHWYNQLEASIVDDLVELYELDFQLFGYDPTPPNRR